MTEDEARRAHVKRHCTRMLSGVRQLTMREQLDLFTRGADLDAAPDRYGDGVVSAVEERVAGLLGTAGAVFLPTGTMAQQIALRYGAERTGSPTVAMHPQGHPETYEGHAYATLAGRRSLWPTTEPRNPTAEEVTAVGEPFGTLLLELPLRDAGFVLPSWDALVAVTAAARAHGARVHLAALPGVRLHPEVPHTHQFQIWLPYPADVLDEAALRLGEGERVWFIGGWQPTPAPGIAVAEVTIAEPALEGTADDVAEIGDRFLERVAALAG